GDREMNDNEYNIVSEVQLERHLLKAPVESINKSFRQSQKMLEKEMTTVVTAINDLNKKKNNLSKDDAKTTIDKLLTRMQTLKRRVEETRDDEDAQIKRFKTRLDHLRGVCNNHSDQYINQEFNVKRVDRILVDYLLREGYYDTAIKLADTSNITELVDIDVFLSSKKVISGLEKHDCTEALAWCNENRSKLKKIDSTMEFSLRIQEFIELVRANKVGPAISYARQHLAPIAATNIKEIQVAMATLAFRHDRTSHEKYTDLFDMERWNDRIRQFKRDNYNVNSLTSRSLIDISLQSGLSVLKTEQCEDEETMNVNCPLCDADFSRLAEPLPVSLQSHSSLICRITGELMTDDNPPMVLPNGNVYCRNAMVEMAAHDDNIITCPRSGAKFNYAELRRAYIA
ncbi:hypothetical protein SAMD00019534_038210, partial [Acytostelium subglobosum LB1]|uniref:hypothetical protein n=1 Tax=Acytostelium subglobosum LB1 TaxID=1410327 RepID=UPI00064488A0